MKTSERIPSSRLLAAVEPEAMEHYRMMRARLWVSAGVEEHICEIVLAMQFAVHGYETQFKVHAQRALALGMSKDQLRGLVMTGLGVTLIACETARALTWLDEACAETEIGS